MELLSTNPLCVLFEPTGAFWTKNTRNPLPRGNRLRIIEISHVVVMKLKSLLIIINLNKLNYESKNNVEIQRSSLFQLQPQFVENYNRLSVKPTEAAKIPYVAGMST